MNRFVLILTSALEALMVLIAGLAISFVPLTLWWFTRIGDGVGFDVYWRGASDVWLLGHGVHFDMILPENIVKASALPGANLAFVVSIAPLAFALLTFLLATRLGRRTVEIGARFTGPITAIATFAGLNALIVLLTMTPGAMPSLWRGFVLPPLIFALGVIVGARGEIGRSGGAAEKVQERVTGWARALDNHWRAVITLSFRAAAGMLASLAGIAAVVLAVLIIVNFPRMVALYEGVQAGPGGSFVITLAQIMLIPNFVIWVISWLTGAGFAIGVGSSVSPLGTQLGPIPSLPVFGVIPEGDIVGGYAWLVIPVALTLVWTIAMRRQLVVRLGGPHLGGWAIMAALLTTVMATGIAMALAWIASGAGGPGRLSEVGVVPWQMGIWIFIEVGIASLIGWLTPNSKTARPVN